MLTTATTAPDPFLHWLLSLDIVHGPTMRIVELVALGLVLGIAIRRWRRLQLVVVPGAALLGAVVGVLLVWAADAGDWFGTSLNRHTYLWAPITFALIGGALATLVMGPRWWRRLLAGLLLPVALVAGVLEVNAGFGINEVLGDLVGVSPDPVETLKPIATPSTSPSASATPLAELYRTWTPPAGMPSKGKTMQVALPNSASGFASRPAGLYLPPAALVPNPPKLPFVVMMMGQPGTPDPRYAAQALDPLAATHDGLAPIVLVVDQLGNPLNDTLCLDTAKYGKVDTFLSQDVVGWARTHLNIDQDSRHWTVAGYSSGGACALELGTKYPGIWQNVLSVSGERFPGSGFYQQNLQNVFGGDLAAYQAEWPQNILPTKHYPDTFGVFTGGASDTKYLGDAKAAVAMTQAAGWNSQLILIPGAGHQFTAVTQGFSKGFAALFSRLGLAP